MPTGVYERQPKPIKEKIIGIYKITNPKNKIYIGQSKDIKHRISCYKSAHCNHQVLLYRSIIKYGWNKHKFEIIHPCLREQLNDLEIYYIELYQCYNSKYGLNLREGGHSKMSKESVIKGTITRTGQKRSDESRKKMSDAQKELYKNGYINPCKGVKHNRISSTTFRKGHPTWNKGFKYPDNYVSKSNKSVVQLSLNNEYIKTFISARKATKETGVNYVTISRCCTNDQSQSGGFRWMFLKDYEKLNYNQ